MFVPRSSAAALAFFAPGALGTPGAYLALGTLLAATMLSCSSSSSPEESAAIEGTVAFGFEVASFRPCGTGEDWWFSGEGDEEVGRDLTSRYYAMTEEQYERVYARLEGSRSEIGMYGHVFAYDREFSLKRIHELRPLIAGECEWEGAPAQ